MPSSSVDVCELPLFPLPEVVLFPGRPLPLHIFEYRYRMMLNTILETDRRFGVLMFDPQRDPLSKWAAVQRWCRCKGCRTTAWIL